MRESAMERPSTDHETRPESGTDIGRLWRRYHFPGEPPRPGSVAEQRLISYAEQYISAATGKTTTRESSDVVREASDRERRNSHNQLAIMIFGELRSGMPQHLAVDISNFAAEVVQPGMTLDDFLEVANLDKPKE